MHFIYRTTNKINGKTYIGQRSITKGWKRYLGSGKALKRAFRKYGKNNFEREIICYACSQKLTNFLERYYIKKEWEKGKGEYNISDGGTGNNGIKHFTTEHRKKISEALKGKKKSKEWLDKIASSKIGIHFKRGPFSEEHKKKLSDARKGRHWFNNGITNIFDYVCPEGYKPGRLAYRIW